jgi:RND family efflux transporter MFP subunit
MSNSYINKQQEADTKEGNWVKEKLIICIRYIIPVATLATGILITLHLLQTGPQAKPISNAGKTGVLVETTQVRFDSYPTKINAMGVVKASKSTDLKPQVSGQVIELADHLIPGGRFTKGDIVLRLDPSDYLLALQQQENEVVQANNDLLIEEGNQIIVKREFDLMGEQVSEVEKKLMLRQPQLSNLQTALTIAQAKTEQAELNLNRTTITAPFNGIVQSREVNVGTWVSTSSTIGTLIGSDSYWVEVSVPEEQLQWISLPNGTNKGSLVRVFNPTAWGDDTYREGTVIQLLPGLETRGRMARLLIEVDDPLALEKVNANKPQILIDSFVRVVIDGKKIPKAFEISREYIHRGNQLWVYGEGGKLAIREVTVGFKNRDSMLIISGVRSGDEVITTNISTPVEGLTLRRMGMGNQSGKGKNTNTLAMNSTWKGKRANNEQ